MAASISVTLGITQRGGSVGIDVCDRLTPAPLGISTTRNVVRSYWVARWEFLRLQAYQSEGAARPFEATSAEASEKLRAAAAWLSSHDPGVFAELRAAGAKAVVLINLTVTDGDDLHLPLPPVFLQACGRLDLEIAIMASSSDVA